MDNDKSFDRDNNNYCKDTEAAAAQLFSSSSSGRYGGDDDSTSNNRSERGERDSNEVLWPPAADWSDERVKTTPTAVVTLTSDENDIPWSP